MIKKERERILNSLKDIPNDKLEDMYYDSVWNCLGSESEIMYERGYDAIDIKEARRHENYLGDYSKILEQECLRRGIKIWEEFYKEELE